MKTRGVRGPQNRKVVIQINTFEDFFNVMPIGSGLPLDLGNEVEMVLVEHPGMASDPAGQYQVRYNHWLNQAVAADIAGVGIHIEESQGDYFLFFERMYA